MASSDQIPGLFSRLVSRIYPDDPQAVVTLVSAFSLLAFAALFIVGVFHQLWHDYDIGWGTVGALVVIIAGPCVLAHVKPPSLPFSPIGLSGPVPSGDTSTSTQNLGGCAGTPEGDK